MLSVHFDDAKTTLIIPLEDDPLSVRPPLRPSVLTPSGAAGVMSKREGGGQLRRIAVVVARIPTRALVAPTEGCGSGLRRPRPRDSLGGSVQSQRCTFLPGQAAARGAALSASGANYFSPDFVLTVAEPIPRLCGTTSGLLVGELMYT